MAYWIEPADRERTFGKDWLMVEDPDGDVHFRVACDAEPFLMPRCVLDQLLRIVYANLDRAALDGHPVVQDPARDG